jgi:hypothetical protein
VGLSGIDYLAEQLAKARLPLLVRTEKAGLGEDGRPVGYHQWVYFRPRAYWHEWLNWPTIFAQTGFFRPDDHPPQQELFQQINRQQFGIAPRPLSGIDYLAEQLAVRPDSRCRTGGGALFRTAGD